MTAATYHDLPLLKGPVWTWEVPAYFFAGGAAGMSAALAASARAAGADEKLVRDARWIAAIGAAVSAPLLISDLGRPERFLNMMRVFKPQSPMSVGAWTLAVFGGAATGAVLAPSKFLRDASGLVAAASGLVMATYTGVLIGATTIPVWKQHVRILPVHFAASALGSAASLLDLRGHRNTTVNSLALGAATYETITTSAIDAQRDRTSQPIRENRAAKWAAILSGPVPLALRMLGQRKAAAVATLTGSLLTRIAWVQAGKASAKDARVAL